jgi:hypothetical protein
MFGRSLAISSSHLKSVVYGLMPESQIFVDKKIASLYIRNINSFNPMPEERNHSFHIEKSLLEN